MCNKSKSLRVSHFLIVITKWILINTQLFGWVAANNCLWDVIKTTIKVSGFTCLIIVNRQRWDNPESWCYQIRLYDMRDLSSTNEMSIKSFYFCLNFFFIWFSMLTTLSKLLNLVLGHWQIISPNFLFSYIVWCMVKLKYKQHKCYESYLKPVQDLGCIDP